MNHKFIQLCSQQDFEHNQEIKYFHENTQSCCFTIHPKCFERPEVVITDEASQRILLEFMSSKWEVLLQAILP